MEKRICKHCGSDVVIHPGSVATKNIYYYCPKCELVREDETWESPKKNSTHTANVIVKSVNIEWNV